MIRSQIHSSARGSSYRPYSCDRMSEAYKAIKERNMSIRGAARQYGVPVTTLMDRASGRVDVDVIKSGKAPMFSLEQEALLSQHVKTMAEVGYGYSRTETINLASDYAVHLGLRDREKPLTDRWLYNFLSRWPELKVKAPRSLEIARAKCATRQAIDNYFLELSAILTKYKLHDKPHMIYNVDEKGLNTDHKPPKIVSGAANKTQAITSGRSKTVTLIGCCNGVGHQVPPYFIFPGERMMPRLLEGSAPGADGCVSSSGWSNSEVFTNYMETHFVKYLPERTEDSHVLVLYDGHKSHVSLGLIEWAKQNRIILFVLPPHCSHLLQPLDAGCFGPFQIAWNSTCHHYMREHGGRVITRFDVCEMACKIYAKTLNPSNIQSSFRRCGIYPFDPSVIADNLIAPSTTFAHPIVEAATNSTQDKSADKFLQEKGGKILENVQIAKTRHTLSKVVGGKPITEPEITLQIQDHINKQKPQKTKSKKSTKSQKKSPKPSTSGVSVQKPTKRCPSPASSSSDDSDVEDSEKCIVCKQL